MDTPNGRYLQAGGVTSLEKGTPMQADSRLEIGSNSKSFTDVLLLQLQEEGVLSLDDPLSKWLPEWAAKIPNGDKMNLRQLAQHTAGIWDYGDKIIGDAANDPAKLAQGYTPAELVQYAIDNGTPDFAPGEEGKWKYSNTGYILLGMILEKATGQTLGELYKARIFEPLGLKTAALIEGVPAAGEITDGYWWTEDGKINNTTNWNVSQGWAAGGIAMTAEELLTYGKALAAGKLFKNPDTLAEMLTFNPNAMNGLMGYGLGLLDFSKVGAPGSWGHEGQTAGFQSLWYTNPDTGVTVVGLTNSAAYSAYSFLNVAGWLAPEASEAAAGAGAAGQASLTAHPWQWTGFTSPMEQFKVETPASYRLTFNEDGTVSIVADCNNAAGSYTATDGALTITIGPMTMAACPPASRSDQFVKLLGGAARYFFVEDRLFIDLMADGGTMAFAPAGAAAADGTSAAAAEKPRYEPLDECFAQPPAGLKIALDMDCGYVVVPESRSGESDREVKLGFTRFNSGKGTASSPLFMLAGGPGQTQISPEFFNMFQTELLGGILEKRDIVVLEQRGTEHTTPFLSCPEVLSAPWAAHEQGLTGKDADAYGINTLQKCIDDFKAQGVNFDAYNSVENAADVNAVREALGYGKIIYYGASYGAQLGQHVMRDFPEILEAVVLDGAEALSRKSWVESKALDAQWGIDNLTRLCEADAKCKATYDIPALVDAALALFDKGPVPYTYTDPSDPSLTIKGEVTVDDMVGLIYGQQGTRTGALSLPAFLAQLAEGGAETVAEVLGSNKAGSLIASRTATTSPMALLMHMAMVCSDDPVKSAAEVKLDGAGRYATLFGQAGGAEYAEFCALIKVKELPDATDVDVKLDVPTLLLSGDLDVATPTFRSQEVADALPNASLVVFPGRTHVQIAAANICAAQVMTQFVSDPTTKPDTSCVKEAPVLGFVLPDGSSSRE